MNPNSDVKVEVFQNEYLPEGGRVVDAVVTVTMGEGAGARRPGPTASAAEVIMIDVSGSMHGDKIVAAKNAACVAIDTIRDGVSFAIIAGTSDARVIFPGGRHLASASGRTRSDAKAAVRRLSANGGTNFSAWLTAAHGLFAASRAEIRHAILLTDGENGDREDDFQRVLNHCAGVFVCDSRGVGDGWRARDLIKVAETLLGTADGIKDSRHLAEDFRQMTENAMGKTVADVALRVWTPGGSRIRFVKQVFPDINDLTARRAEVSARVGDYPTGAWGAESRDYHLCVEVAPGAVGEEVLAARVSLVHQDEILGQGLVRAVWTDDLAAATVINRKVADYSDQAELAQAIQEGLSARAAGDVTTATARLGRAVQLAAASGREDTAKVLGTVVEIVDAATGTVRLKSRSENREVDVDAEIAAVGSRKTRRVRPTE
ncbi:VWA domain-containing protein [Luedemannella flava]|uniref:VWA domain-containing protein n=1 Tax=Luedemannella flava TaxID=349316 RepID=A0ABP4YHE0_9ACTN